MEAPDHRLDASAPTRHGGEGAGFYVDVCERFVSGPRGQRGKAFSELLGQLRALAQNGEYARAAAILGRVISPALDYTSAQSLARMRDGLRGKNTARHQLKMAIISNCTTKQLVALIDLFLFGAGVEADIYEPEYGLLRQEIIDENSGLYQANPKVVFLAANRRDLANRPEPSAEGKQVDELVALESKQWSELWNAAHGRLHCQIIQNNFTLPPWRSFGNYERRQAGSMGRFIARLNDSLGDIAPAYVTIHDVDHLASTAGRWRWDDPRFFHQAKLPCDPECLVDYAHSVASLILAQLGLAKKCLVLDLDNTLWGGVIGDDGLGGIRLGQGNAEGEAFIEFQTYLQALRRRGVLLAICSKNDERNALEVFDKHTEMVLRRNDISSFVVNWDDKAGNIRNIARQLNIGLDSLVFVDDNPAERAIVRQAVPEVAVPELPEDVTGYIRALEQHRYFQTIGVAAEDFQRTEYYQADSMRRKAQASTTDMPAFLRSLEMTARIGPISSATLERSAQLLQRSNQFNLTTRRRSAAELMALVDSPDWITRTVSLADRFGDNGLISVILGVVKGDRLEIDTWLMSCRVLKRGVEQFALNHLAQAALDRGLKALYGVYVPTSKNALVRDHYATLGFERAGPENNGETHWQLLLKGWKPTPTFIEAVKG